MPSLRPACWGRQSALLGGCHGQAPQAEKGVRATRVCDLHCSDPHLGWAPPSHSCSGPAGNKGAAAAQVSLIPAPKQGWET